MVLSRRGKGFWGFASLAILVAFISVAVYMYMFGSNGSAAAVGAGATVFIVLVLPVLFAVLAFVVAKRTNAPGGPWLWAVVNLFFPVMGIAVMMLVTAYQQKRDAALQVAEQAPATPQPAPERECSYCGAIIPVAAGKCPHCAAPR